MWPEKVVSEGCGGCIWDGVFVLIAADPERSGRDNEGKELCVRKPVCRDPAVLKQEIGY